MMKTKLTLWVCLTVCVAFTSCQKKIMEELKNTDKSGALKANSYTPTVYYVSPGGSDTNLGTSVSTPLKTLKMAVSKTNPGDSVKVLPGNYQWATGAGDAIITINRSGEAGAPITYIAYDPQNKPVIISNSTDNVNGTFKAVSINANYINFINFIVKGDLIGSQISEQSDVAKYNTAGIQFGGFNGIASTPRHDAVIRGCTIYNFPGGGIVANYISQVKIESNIVYNTCWYTEYGMSGISVYRPVNLDSTSTNDQAHPKIIVRNNVCHNNNVTIIPKNGTKITDGNGIIIDVNLNSGTYKAYNGFTQVENNICYNNGGAGIQVTKAHNVTIVNNTSYHNGLRTDASNNSSAEMDIYGAYDVNIYNNVFFAKNSGLSTNKKGNTEYPISNIKYDYNLFYNGGFYPAITSPDLTPDTTETPARTGNPQFVGPLPALPTLPLTSPNIGLTSTSINAFMLPSNSPGVNTGLGIYYSASDKIGVTRPKGTYPDCGAFEYVPGP